MAIRIFGPGHPLDGTVLHPETPLQESQVQLLLAPGLHALPVAGGKTLYWRGGDGSPFTFAYSPDRR